MITDANLTAKRFDEMEAGLGGVFIRARAELGVSSFGMQLIDLPPDFDEPYAEHAHWGMPPEMDFANHGQEEVYVPLSGRGTLIAGDERIELVLGMAVRIGAERRRNVVTGPEGLRYLALGGNPGKAYEPPAFSELGAGETPTVAA